MAQPFVEPCSHGLIQAEPERRERDLPAARKRMVLAACVLASSMAFIDGSALSVALPRLRIYFDAEFSAVQWVLNGYVVALASMTLIGGALADAYGKARMLGIGCLGFGLASLACIVAPSIEWLIIARVVQGVSAAILTPSSLALIGATYPKNERSRAIAVWAAASALTTAGGPVLGGWLTQSLGWQWVFAINPPLVLGVLVLLARFAPADRLESRRFDLPGAAILAVGLAVLAWALGEIGPNGVGESNPALVIAGVLFGAVALVAYAAWERASDHPMTPPRVAGNRGFVGLNVATLLLYGALAIMFFIVSFDLIDRRGLTPTGAGLAFLPFTLSIGLLSRFVGARADQAGARSMLIGGSVGAGIAYAWMAFGKGASLWTGVVAPMVLLGISFAVLVAPLTASVMSSLSATDEGLASGINNAVSRIAQMVGVALAAGIASYAFGYQAALAVAAVLSLGAAAFIALKVPAAALTATTSTSSTSSITSTTS